MLLNAIGIVGIFLGSVYPAARSSFPAIFAARRSSGVLDARVAALGHLPRSSSSLLPGSAVWERGLGRLKIYMFAI